MPRKLIEVAATVVKERMRFGDCEPYTVILSGTAESEDGGPVQRLTLKGQTDGEGEDLEPKQHLTYRFYGNWSNYENKRTGETERQFHFQTFVRSEPYSRAGIVAYLDGAPGIGRILAGRLFDKFGSKAVMMLRTQPEAAAAAVERLSSEAAWEAAEYLEREKLLEGCLIELTDLLAGRGFPKKLAKDAVKKYGNLAAFKIRRDPYIVMNFHGCGFKRADAMYLDLGHDPKKLKRQALCAWHAIAKQTEGSTWHFRQVVDNSLIDSIGGANVKADKAIELANRGGIISIMRSQELNGPPDWDGRYMWLAEETKARAELRLAMYVVEAMKEQG